MVEFMRLTLALPKPVLGWMGLLGAVNFIAPLAFLGTIEGKVILVSFILSAGLMMGIAARAGFGRLMGMGHAPWFLALPWLVTRMEGADPATAFGIWLWAVLVIDGVSLVFDVRDALRFAMGNRDPVATLAPKGG